MKGREALEEHAHAAGHGRWWFSDRRFTHSETEALVIIEACQLLGVPVTDRLTSRAWLNLVDRVMRIEERLERLEVDQNRRPDGDLE